MKALRLSPIFSLALILSPAFLSAQNTNEEARRKAGNVANPATTAARSQAVTEADAVLAGWVLTNSDNAAAMASLALQHSKNPEVRQFAQMVIDDHQRCATQLQPYVAGLAAARPAGGVKTDADKPANDDGSAPKPRDATSTRNGAGAGFDHLALIRELGAKCRESSLRLHQEHAGAGFDRFFVGTQVAGHVHALDMTEVFGRHASAELRSKLSEGGRTLQKHLEHGKLLCKQLDATTKPAVDGDNDSRNGK